MPISHLLSQSYHQDHQPGRSPTESAVSENGIVNPATEIQQPTGERLVLIDTDAGSDDAWAVFMALAAQRVATSATSPGFRIVGITTVYGNATVDYVTNNVTRILDTVKDTTIPIYRGMDSSMVGKFQNSQEQPYNGIDGFGDANLPVIPTRIQPQHSVDAIINLAKTYQGQLTIMCIGPLTNLALAVKLRPEIKNWVKEIYILGGNIEGVGNVTASSEFNFFVDPEAAQVVLEDFGPCPRTILPWETCMKFAPSSHDWRTNVLGNMRTQEIDLLNKIEAKILGTYTDNWMSSDAVLVACAINANVIKKTESYYCSVELQGSQTRGMMVVDRNFTQQKLANATIITDIDKPLLESMLIWAAGGPGFKLSNI